MILNKLYNTLNTKLKALFPGAYITMQGTVDGQENHRFEIELIPKESKRDGDLIHHQLLLHLHYKDATKNHLEKIKVFEQLVEGFVTGITLDGEQYIPNQFSMDSADSGTIIKFMLTVCYQRNQIVDAPKMTDLIIKEE